MADGLFLYKSYDGYVVMDKNDNILKLYLNMPNILFDYHNKYDPA